LEQFIQADWLLVGVYALIFGGITFVLELPLSYYSGFVLPHRFEQSNQTFTGWVTDQVKSLLVAGILGVSILQIVYWLLRSQPQTWWLWFAAILLLFNTVMANLAPVVILPLFYKLKPLGDDFGDLVDRLVELTEKAGARVRGVYQLDMSSRTKSANAALMGLGNTRRIVLGDTLLENFSPDEIETILAHELGHHVHNDLPKSILFESLLTLGGLYLAALVLAWGNNIFGFSGPGDIANLPLLGLVLGAFGLVTLPLSNAFSRWRERLADEYALDLTGKGDAYASALIRLANQNLAQVDPEPWVELLLYSHPPLGKRIENARRH
jgi:STE24 endopeptidase